MIEKPKYIAAFGISEPEKKFPFNDEWNPMGISIFTHTLNQCRVTIASCSIEKKAWIWSEIENRWILFAERTSIWKDENEK